MTKLTAQSKDLQSQLDSAEKRYSLDVEEMKMNTEDETSKLQEQVIELESKLRLAEESLESTKKRFETDQAIALQKSEFAEVQLKDARL